METMTKEFCFFLNEHYNTILRGFLEYLFLQGPIFVMGCCPTNRLLCLKGSIFNAATTYRCWEHFILRTSAIRKKKTCIIISKATSFAGKNNSDLMISVKHIPTGPCGQTSSKHKWQNNGERNYKTPSSRAIKSSRIWAVSPLLARETLDHPERGVQVLY